MRHRLFLGLRLVYEYFALYAGLGLLGLCSLAWSLFAVPLYHLLPEAVGIRIGRQVITQAFRFYLGSLSFLRACHFDLSALDSLRDQGPLLIVPNHPCLLDAFFVLSRLDNVACIMKADIVDNLFLGSGARLAGYIRNDLPLDMILAAVDELGCGSPILLFPEGTRTVTWPLNPFQKSVARIAHRAQVPVQTVFIETDSAYLSKGWSLFRKPTTLPIHYRVRLGKRFNPPQDANRFSQELYAYFEQELRLHPPLLCDLPTPPVAAVAVKT
jgi:1-acyl-sn-glycerol-3-phosphate acyltransferase